MRIFKQREKPRALHLSSRAQVAGGLKFLAVMRERLTRSPLLNAPHFVEALQQSYCGAWQRAVVEGETSC